MENIKIFLKSIGLKKKGSIFFIENNNYCVFIDFQKSRFSDEYYINLSFVCSNENHSYKYYDAKLHGRVTNKLNDLMEFTLNNENKINTFKIVISKVINDFLKVKTKKDIIDFIKKYIIISNRELSSMEKEIIANIPEYK